MATELSNVAYIASITPSPQTGRGFDVLTLGEVADRVNNHITAPTLADPAVVRTGHRTLKVYPNTITAVDMMWYRYPRQAVVAMIRNSVTLKPEYDEANSTELEWDDINKVEIAYMILRDAGMNIERRDVQAYADNLVKTGK